MQNNNKRKTKNEKRKTKNDILICSYWANFGV